MPISPARNMMRAAMMIVQCALPQRLLARRSRPDLTKPRVVARHDGRAGRRYARYLLTSHVTPAALVMICESGFSAAISAFLLGASFAAMPGSSLSTSICARASCAHFRSRIPGRGALLTDCLCLRAIGAPSGSFSVSARLHYRAFKRARASAGRGASHRAACSFESRRLRGIVPLLH